MTKTCTLRWRRQPRETGLRAVTQGPRGWQLFAGAVKVASVNAAYADFSREVRGWYWVAGADEMGVRLHNSSASPSLSPSHARDEVVRYVMAALEDHVLDTRFKAPTRCPHADDYEPAAREGEA